MRTWRRKFPPYRLISSPCLLLILAVLSVYGLYFSTHKNRISHDDSPTSDGNGPNQIQQPAVRLHWRYAYQPLVLGWTSYFNRNGALIKELTGSLEMDEENGGLEDCPWKCEYSDDRKSYEPNRPTVFVYHSTNISPNDMPKSVQGYHLNVFFTLESPVNAGRNYKQLPADFFNLTMTYRSDSNLPWPYDAFEKRDSEDGEEAHFWNWDDVVSQVAKKSKLALAAISHCKTDSRREDYLRALREEIPITEFGACYGNTSCGGECMEREINDHLFYLAFENSVCVDYLSEKFWKAVRHTIVPVVLTRRVFSTKLAKQIPHSAFIAADDFNSPKQLANYLRYLAEDRTAYLRHLDWTRRYNKIVYRANAKNMCRLCEMAVKRERVAGVRDLAEWWEGDGQCQKDFAINELI